ncbi:MAG: hypothetical protein ACRDIB_13690, partial [Ardenticatenaceae bacterium]
MNTLMRPGFILAMLVTLLLTVGPPAPASSSAGEGNRVVRVPPSALGDVATLDLQPIVDLDYSAFRWLELSAADYMSLEAAGIPHEVQEEPFTLRLGEQSFDPLRDGVTLPEGWDSVQSNGPDLYLVQVVAPTQASWLDTLRAGGLEIVQYIHPHTYVVWGEPAAVERVAPANFVRWTGPFAPAYRVLPQWRALPDTSLAARVLLYRGAGADAIVQQIEQLGGVVDGRRALNQIFEQVTLNISGARFQAVAQIPGVYSVKPQPTDGGPRGEMSNQVNVNNVDEDNQ